MDNITIRFSGVTFDLNKLLVFLKKNKARESSKPDDVFLFTRKVGKHKAGWLFRLDIRNKNILCSGGPTSTFFGFNAWVSLKHSTQMATIVNILRKKLEQMDGVMLSEVVSPTVHRVEITHLYRFDSIDEIAQAEIALYSNLVVRYPKKVMMSGASMDVPGMIRVGLNKSLTTLRVYPEELKLETKPAHLYSAEWKKLREELKNCLRVECIFDSVQLKAAGLDKAEEWGCLDNLEKLVDDRMSEAGLRNTMPQSVEKLDAYLAGPKQSKVKDFMAGWKAGKSIDVNGTWSAVQVDAKAMGFDITMPYSHQRHLAHGLHGRFDTSQVVELSETLRNDEVLFERWWNKSLMA